MSGNQVKVNIYGAIQAARQAENLPPNKLLAEPVDNSIDAGATKVLIRVFDDAIVFADDGRGVEEMDVLFDPYYSTKGNDVNSIGRFGIGLNSMVHKAGFTQRVVSIVDGQMKYGSIDWPKTECSNDEIQWKPDRLALTKYENELIKTGYKTIITVSDLTPEWKNHFKDPKNNPVKLRRLASRFFQPIQRKDVALLVQLRKEETPTILAEDHLYQGRTVKEEAPSEIDVNGARAVVRVFTSPEAIPEVTGRVHFCFYPRTISDEKVILGHKIPNVLGVIVELNREDWKKKLSTHKNAFDPPDDPQVKELLKSVYESIRFYINRLKEEDALRHELNLFDTVSRELSNDFASWATQGKRKTGGKRQRPRCPECKTVGVQVRHGRPCPQCGYEPDAPKCPKCGKENESPRNGKPCSSCGYEPTKSTSRPEFVGDGISPTGGSDKCGGRGEPHSILIDEKLDSGMPKFDFMGNALSVPYEVVMSEIEGSVQIRIYLNRESPDLQRALLHNSTDESKNAIKALAINALATELSYQGRIDVIDKLFPSDEASEIKDLLSNATYASERNAYMAKILFDRFESRQDDKKRAASGGK